MSTVDCQAIRYAFRGLASAASDEVAKPDTIIDSGVLRQIYDFLVAADAKMVSFAPDSTSSIPQLPPQTQPLPADTLALPLFDALRRGLFLRTKSTLAPTNVPIIR
jgi:hypothetical protein